MRAKAIKGITAVSNSFTTLSMLEMILITFLINKNYFPTGACLLKYILQSLLSYKVVKNALLFSVWYVWITGSNEKEA